MKIESVTDYSISNRKTDNSDPASVNKGGKANSIYAGNLNLAQPDFIAAKKENAQKQALHTLLKQFASDQNVDSLYEECRKLQKEYSKDAAISDQKVNDIQADKEAAMAAYQIDPDSREQKQVEALAKSLYDARSLTDEDKELLEEFKDVDMGLFVDSVLEPAFLTPAERQRAADMPFTDYQKGVLRDEVMQHYFMQDRDRNIKASISANQNIEEIRQGRLKADPMNKAGKKAEEILEKASREIISMMTQEAVDTIDKEADKMEEKIQEEKEKKKEEEKLKGEGQKEAAPQEITAHTLKASATMDDVKQELKKLMQAQNLIEEDMKGAAIDEEL